jgi:hypothetical protein
MVKDITFHYTNEEMVKDLISITPIQPTDTVLDAGSGLNKVWYNNLPNEIKYECEIDDGNDFFEWDITVDWVIGNPPFHIGWAFTEKAISIAKKGIAFLGSNKFLNSNMTPRRLQFLQDNGFTLSRLHIVQDKRWYGRYYYLIFSQEENDFVSWKEGTYK